MTFKNHIFTSIRINTTANNIISKASPHTIKKFELIEEYIKSWAQKLMLNDYCNGLIFIDCMCNSGIYTDNAGQIVKGTAVRVSEELLRVARTYPKKRVFIFLNDKNANRVDELETHLPQDEVNFQVVTSKNDANEFLKTIGPQLNKSSLHYFLLYDPYDASIDWEALEPFFLNWGEVLITHMVSDPIRAIKTAKKKATKDKYEKTYHEDFKDLLLYGSDKDAFDSLVDNIIAAKHGPGRYYKAKFPFYNSNNSRLYSLIHCTSHKEGFKLFKKCAWKVFGAQSSNKHASNSGQMSFDFDGTITFDTDVSCFNIRDIAKYLHNSFKGIRQVPLSNLWDLLDEHPIFPSENFRKEIKNELVTFYGAKIERITRPETNKLEEVISFSQKEGL